MKIEDIKELLGIGSLVDGNGCPLINENNCRIMQSTKEWYDKIKYDDKLADYFNSIQGGNYKKAMMNHKYVFSFFGRGNGEMIFYRLYEVIDVKKIKDVIGGKYFPDEDVLDYENNVHKINRGSDDPFFIIKGIDTPGKLEKRLITPVTKGQQKIIKYETFAKYDITAIEKIKLATEFNSYEDICLNYNELKEVINDGIWQERLSRYGGVYLIHDKYTGKNYIGSAYNETGGFLGRWKDYANNPTGGEKDSGNTMLIELLEKGMHGNDTNLRGKKYAEKYFIYSVLEVLPLGNSKRILNAESRWKQHLGTRDKKHGLNGN